MRLILMHKINFQRLNQMSMLSAFKTAKILEKMRGRSQCELAENWTVKRKNNKGDYEIVEKQ